MESFIFIISTGDRDAHGSRLNMDGWILDRYELNPIVLWMEDNPFLPDDPDTAIGYSRIWFENRKLMAEWIPDPTSKIATKLARKLKGGTSLGASVNFIPHGPVRYGTGDEAKGGKNETLYYSRQELLSWKLCYIPSNPECIYQKNYKGDKGASRMQRDRKIKLIELQLKHGI